MVLGVNGPLNQALLKRSRWKRLSSRDQWNLTPATMCCGSAARAVWSRRFGAVQTMLLCTRTSAPTSNFYSHTQKMSRALSLCKKVLYTLHHGARTTVSLNVSKTKELIVDFRKRQQRPYTPLMISGTPVERVSSFKYLGVNISEDLTWTAHIQTQVKKARQRLYHLRQLRKFRVSPAILKLSIQGP